MAKGYILNSIGARLKQRIRACTALPEGLKLWLPRSISILPAQATKVDSLPKGRQRTRSVRVGVATLRRLVREGRVKGEDYVINGTSRASVI